MSEWVSAICGLGAGVVTAAASVIIYAIGVKKERKERLREDQKAKDDRFGNAVSSVARYIATPHTPLRWDAISAVSVYHAHTQDAVSEDLLRALIRDDHSEAAVLCLFGGCDNACGNDICRKCVAAVNRMASRGRIDTTAPLPVAVDP